MLRRCFMFTLVPLVLVGCASDPSEEETASQSLAASACGTPLAEVDGVYAYSNGGYTNTGYSCAGISPVGAYLYQCVEFAQRYMNKIYGIQALWPVGAAAEMCTSQPPGVQTHWARSGYAPKKGDLVVWGAVAGNPWGHVGVVRKAVPGGIEIVEQNASINGSNGVRTLWGSPTQGYAATGGSPIACFVTAKANTGSGSTSPATGTCALGDGLYCGTNGAGNDPTKLYRCTGGQPAAIESCALGCEWRPAGQNDRCRMNAECPYGAGLYCGGNGISGDPNVLFECGGGRIKARERCTHGCKRMAVGFNDQCN